MRLEETGTWGLGAGTGEGVLLPCLHCQEGFSVWAALEGFAGEDGDLLCPVAGDTGEDVAKNGGFCVDRGEQRGDGRA